jgi:hypothetical protein
MVDGEGKRASLESLWRVYEVHGQNLRHVGRACASSKHERGGVYRLLEDLRSQFEPCKSSHRCRVGCSYSDVYPPVHHLPARTIFTFDDQKLSAHCRQMTSDGEVCLGVLCTLQFLAVVMCCGESEQNISRWC